MRRQTEVAGQLPPLVYGTLPALQRVDVQAMCACANTPPAVRKLVWVADALGVEHALLFDARRSVSTLRRSVLALCPRERLVLAHLDEPPLALGDATSRLTLETALLSRDTALGRVRARRGAHAAIVAYELRCRRVPLCHRAVTRLFVSLERELSATHWRRISEVALLRNLRVLLDYATACDGRKRDCDCLARRVLEHSHAGWLQLHAVYELPEPCTPLDVLLACYSLSTLLAQAARGVTRAILTEVPPPLREDARLALAVPLEVRLRCAQSLEPSVRELLDSSSGAPLKRGCRALMVTWLLNRARRPLRWCELNN